MAKFSLLYPLKDFQFLASAVNQATYVSIDVFDSWQAFLFGDFYYEADNFVGASVYFEAVLISDGTDTMYAALFNEGGTELASSEISSTSTNSVLLRSSAVTMTDTDEYHVRFKTSAELANLGLAAPRVIADFDTSAEAPIESHHMLYGGDYRVWNTPDADFFTFLPAGAPDDEFGSWFHYDARNWDVGTQFFFEANMVQVGTGECRAQFYDWTLDADVASGLATTTSTTQTRVRTSALTLVDGHDYVVGLGSTGANSSNASYFNLCKIIAYVAEPRLFEIHHGFGTNSYSDANHTSYVGYAAGRLRFNPAVWDEDNVLAVYFEAIVEAGVGETVYQELAWWFSAGVHTEISGTEISTTTNTATRIRSGDIKTILFTTLGANVELKSLWKVSGGSTGNNIISMGKLIYVYSPPVNLVAAQDGADIGLEWNY